MPMRPSFYLLFNSMNPLKHDIFRMFSHKRIKTAIKAVFIRLVELRGTVASLLPNPWGSLNKRKDTRRCLFFCWWS
jgi:hypothetical protein